MADILEFRSRRTDPPRNVRPANLHFEPAAPRRRRSPRRTIRRSYGLVLLVALTGLAVWAKAAGLPMPALFSQDAKQSVSRPFPLCAAGARIDCVVDGDTFYFGGEKVRMADIDTPEIFSPRCRAEKALGEKARTRLHGLLNAGPIELRRVDRDRDRYGRLLRTVHRDGRSLGAVLLAEGLAHGSGAFGRGWCA